MSDTSPTPAPKLAREPDNGVLFLTTTGLGIHIDNLSRLISSYVRRSGVGKPGSCHLFRHTMATLMLEGGADIRFVQQMLGHSQHLQHPALHAGLPACPGGGPLGHASWRCERAAQGS